MFNPDGHLSEAFADKLWLFLLCNTHVTSYGVQAAEGRSAKRGKFRHLRRRRRRKERRRAAKMAWKWSLNTGELFFQLSIIIIIIINRNEQLVLNERRDTHRTCPQFFTGQTNLHTCICFVCKSTLIHATIWEITEPQIKYEKRNIFILCGFGDIWSSLTPIF